jgi:hypothetical protein
MLLVPLVASLGGCQPTIAWFTAQFAPPQKVEAIYKPPKDKKVLVFVDDLRCPVSYDPLKADLTEQLNRHIKEQKLAAETIPYERLVDLMAATPNFNQLHVPDVGQKLSAELVLYVEITKFSLKDNEGSPLWQGKLGVSVKWVDATGRIWPRDRPDGYPLPSVDLPSVENAAVTYGSEVAKELANQMADKVAKLFYDHTGPPLGTR